MKRKIFLVAGIAVLIGLLIVGGISFSRFLENKRAEKEKQLQIESLVQRTLDGYLKVEKAVDCVQANYVSYISSMLADVENGNYTEEKEQQAYCAMWTNMGNQLKAFGIDSVPCEYTHIEDPSLKELYNASDSIYHISRDCNFQIDPTLEDDRGVEEWGWGNPYDVPEVMKGKRESLSKIGTILNKYKEGFYKEQRTKEKADLNTMAKSELEKLAESGDANAQAKVGLVLVSGYNNVKRRSSDKEKNIKRGTDFLMKAAKQGNWEALGDLGFICYCNGINSSLYGGGTTREWMLKGAIMGNASAMHALATLYYEKGDKKNAIKWYIRAANYGCLESFHNASIGLKQGWNGKVDEKRSEKYQKLMDEDKRLMDTINRLNQ